MEDVKSFRDLFDICKEIPVEFISVDELHGISKIQDGKNKYIDFLNKNMVRPYSEKLQHFSYGLVTSKDSERMETYLLDGYLNLSLKRGICYDRESLIDALNQFMCVHPKEGCTFTEKLDTLKEQLKNYLVFGASKLDREMKKKFKTQIENYQKRFEQWKAQTARQTLTLSQPMSSFPNSFMSQMQKPSSMIAIPELQFHEFEEENIEEFIDSLRRDKRLNQEQLMDCFDYECFCFFIVKKYLEGYITFFEADKQGMTDISPEHKDYAAKMIHFFYDYFAAIDLIREINPEYELDISSLRQNPYFLRDCDEKEYSIDALRQKFNEFLYRNPEFAINPIDELGVTWEILPHGKGDKKNPGPDKEHPPRPPQDEDELYRKQRISRNFLESSGAIYKVRSQIIPGEINPFSNYIGYIYPNGRVIFEAFYDKPTTAKKLPSNATYVMNVTNFIALSRIPKKELAEQMKQGKLHGAYRIFHDKTMAEWKSGVSEAISNNDYTDDVKKRIDSLIESKVLSKEGEKSK